VGAVIAMAVSLATTLLAATLPAYACAAAAQVPATIPVEENPSAPITHAGHAGPPIVNTTVPTVPTTTAANNPIVVEVKSRVLLFF
jgi:hypothetical protein